MLKTMQCVTQSQKFRFLSCSVEVWDHGDFVSSIRRRHSSVNAPVELPCTVHEKIEAKKCQKKTINCQKQKKTSRATNRTDALPVLHSVTSTSEPNQQQLPEISLLFNDITTSKLAKRYQKKRIPRSRKNYSFT